jgi:TRAP-type C4-dicarboxylate transport system permease small subunit
MEQPSPSGWASWAVRIYGSWLARLETFLIVFFLGVVVLGSLGVLFGLFADASTAQLVVYACAFHLCLFGAVSATRQSNHIAVDAITPHLKPTVQRWVEGVLLVGSGVVAVILTRLAYDFIFGVIPADDLLVKDGEGAIWSRRLWYSPVVIALAWIALHFFVMGALRLAGKDPVALGIAPTPKVSVDMQDEGAT